MEEFTQVTRPEGDKDQYVPYDARGNVTQLTRKKEASVPDWRIL